MARLFPGIDPFIEAQHYWPDFHTRTITYLCDAVADHLPDPYSIRMEERIYLVEGFPDETKSRKEPDLVIERSSGFSMAQRGMTVLEMEPTTIPVSLIEEVKEIHVEIIHRPDQSLVTVLDLLSPENKSGSGFVQYLSKRNALLQGSVHLVEFDLLVSGHRMPMARTLPPGDAYVIVARGDRRPDCDVYAWSIRHPLTKVLIPLLAPDPDVLLDLAAVYEMAFEKGRYARSIDYQKPPTLGLAPDDRAWAEALAKGLDR